MHSNFAFCFSFNFDFEIVDCHTIFFPCATMNTRQSTSTSSPFALDLIEALQDPSVVEAFRKAQIVDSDIIADRVEAKLNKRLKKMEKELAAKDEHITTLEKRIEDLEAKADDQEQYSRRTSVRIYGVPETPGEDVLSLSKDLFEKVNLSPSINRVHRVGPLRKSSPANPSSSNETADANPSPTSPRPILCQFVSYPDKAAVMKRRKDLSDEYPDVHVNEDLTRKRANILFEARKLKRAKTIKDCWSFDGRLAIRDLRNVVVPIHKLSDLSNRS